jgi:hypothetical protein
MPFIEHIPFRRWKKYAPLSTLLLKVYPFQNLLAELGGDIFRVLDAGLIAMLDCQCWLEYMGIGKCLVDVRYEAGVGDLLI